MYDGQILICMTGESGPAGKGPGDGPLSCMIEKSVSICLAELSVS